MLANAADTQKWDRYRGDADPVVDPLSIAKCSDW